MEATPEAIIPWSSLLAWAIGGLATLVVTTILGVYIVRAWEKREGKVVAALKSPRAPWVLAIIAYLMTLGMMAWRLSAVEKSVQNMITTSAAATKAAEVARDTAVSDLEDCEKRATMAIGERDAAREEIATLEAAPPKVASRASPPVSVGSIETQINSPGNIGTVIGTLNERLPQRRLSQEQRRQLVAWLTGDSPHTVTITFTASIVESERYASDLASAIREARWTVSTPIGAAIHRPTLTGLRITVPDENTPGAARLQGGLKAVGVEAPGQKDPALAAGSILLAVGVQPE